VLTTRPAAHWLAEFGAAGVPAAEVQDLSQVLARPQVGALGAVQELQHETAGAYRLIGPPLRVDQAALSYPSPAPALGSDTRAVLTESGLAPEDIDRLVEDGIAVTA
jgi:crotonobetainyl-CoA:carnitine CoA-transferase CaiB-like acyl-CoA transferase